MQWQPPHGRYGFLAWSPGGHPAPAETARIAPQVFISTCHGIGLDYARKKTADQLVGECWFPWRWPCARSTCTSTQSGSVARDSEKALIQARLARGSRFHPIVATKADHQPADEFNLAPAAKGGRKRCSYVSVRSLPGVEPERCGAESVRLT